MTKKWYMKLSGRKGRTLKRSPSLDWARRAAGASSQHADAAGAAWHRHRPEMLTWVQHPCVATRRGTGLLCTCRDRQARPHSLGDAHPPGSVPPAPRTKQPLPHCGGWSPPRYRILVTLLPASAAGLHLPSDWEGVKHRRPLHHQNCVFLLLREVL